MATDTAPALNIRDRVVELRRVRANEISPHELNAREHPESQRNALRAMLGSLGFAGAVLAVERDGRLKCCDGHLRTEEMGDREVPVLVLDLNDDEVKQFLLSFDAIGQMAKFSKDRLDFLLADYDRTKPSVDQDMVNGLRGDLEKMLKGLAKDAGSDWGKTQEAIDDEAPAPPTVAISEAGDLWVLGRHRLKCGDSTNSEHVAECLAGAEPFMMVTDPPYGVEYDPTFRSDNRTGVVVNDHTASWPAAYRLFAGPVAYVWHGGLHVVTVATDLENCGFDLRAMIIWMKPSLVMGRGHYHWQHEGCFYAARGTAKWCGDRTQSTNWQIQNVHPTHGTTDDGQTEHGCQKPVECMARPIRNHGDKDDAVYDPFVGSGTTIIACEQLGRRGYFMEIDPRYVDVCAERWGRFVGQEPILESTGETFTQVKARREAERAARALEQPAESPATEPSATIPAPAPQQNGSKGKKKKR